MTPEANARCRILIVEDHPMTRHGVAERLSAEANLEVCGEAGDAASALQVVRTCRPDLVLVDLSLVGKSGLRLVEELHRSLPALPVLVYSMHYETLYAERSLRAGARGYVMKSDGAEKLIEAIRVVRRGGVSLSAVMRDRALHPFVLGPAEALQDNTGLLSDLETRIFRLVGQGLETNRMAEQLGLAVDAAKDHEARIRHKLHLRSRLDLQRAAMSWAAKLRR